MVSYHRQASGQDRTESQRGYQVSAKRHRHRVRGADSTLELSDYAILTVVVTMQAGARPVCPSFLFPQFTRSRAKLIAWLRLGLHHDCFTGTVAGAVLKKWQGVTMCADRVTCSLGMSTSDTCLCMGDTANTSATCISHIRVRTKATGRANSQMLQPCKC